MILSLPLLLPLLSCAYASIAVRQALVHESADGHIFITTLDAAGGAPISPSTPARSSISQSAANSIFVSASSTIRTIIKTSAAEPAVSSLAKPSSMISIYTYSSSSPTANLAANRPTRSTLGGSSSHLSHLASNNKAHPTLSSTSSWSRIISIDLSSSGKSTQASPASSISRPLPTATISPTSPYRTIVQASASASSSLSFTSTITSAPKPAGNGTRLGNWPASITYCLQSNGQPIIMVGYMATGTNGVSTITNTSPSQSILSATVRASCSGEVAVFSAGTITTIKLSTLPVASTFSQAVAAQTLSVNGTPVIYSPITLPGYSNTEPVKISTSFVETVNNQTTTQAGWWLIGPYGRIDPPNNRPWRTDSGNFGCISEPLFCDAPCDNVNVGGGWFVHIPLTKCTPGITGPPGWPGGPIIVSGPGEPINDPPPYPKSSDDPKKYNPSNCDKDGIECSVPTITTTRNSTSLQTSSDIASKTPYFLIAAKYADQSIIERELRNVNAKPNGLYSPNVNGTSSSNGTWIDVDLTSQEASSMASRSDIALVMTCAHIPIDSAGPSLTAVSAATTVTLDTLTADTTTAALRPKYGRRLSDQRLQARQASHFRRRETGRDLIDSVQDLSKRDPGTRIIRQHDSLKDLSVLAWAPGVPSVDEVDYVMHESKGEYTWIYVVDSGVDMNHVDFQGNWEGGDDTNIDSDWLWAPGIAEVRRDLDHNGHGTCMASKISGRVSGVAKQPIVIPAVFENTYQSHIAILQQLEIDIRSRQSRGGTNKQSLPGKTVVSLSYGIPVSDPRYSIMVKGALRDIMNLGILVVTAAGNGNGNHVRKRDDGTEILGFVSPLVPAALASNDFPLIRVGAVDKAGIIAYFSQEGDVYADGVSGRCAKPETEDYRNAIGTSAATAAFAGLLSTEIGLEDPPFVIGDDISEFQQTAKDYYVTGPGAYVRPNGQYRVAWNGLDGSRRPVCPPVHKKRQEKLEDICRSVSTASSASSTISMTSSVSSTISPASSASPTTSIASSASPTISTTSSASPTTSIASFASSTISIASFASSTISPASSVSSTISTTSFVSPTTSPSSSAIPIQITNSDNKINIDFYYSNQVPCYNIDCRMPFYAYRVDGSKSLPLQRCDGGLGKGITSVQFRVDTLSGTGYNFTYDPFSVPGGSITGNFSGSVICSPSSNSNTAWACGPTKRSEYPDPTFHTVVSYHQWASCILNIS